MGLFDRSGGAQVTVTPAVVSPRQVVQATITTDKAITKVTAATVEWGYTNFYRYHWAGRADAAATVGNDSLWNMGQVGTNYGSEKDTDDWVGVTKVELPIATGEFTCGSSAFTVPSWAPGSSPVLAQWSCRVTVDRGGRDVDTRVPVRRSHCRLHCRYRPMPPRRRRRFIRRCGGPSKRGCSTRDSTATCPSVYAARSLLSTRRSQAREIAEASAICSGVGRTPV